MMNTDKIEVSLDRVREIIKNFGSNEFSTADVLREYSGGFYSNKKTPAHYSFNAQFGKLLSKNSKYLGLIQVQDNAAVKDDGGHPTSSAFWKLEN